MTIVKKRTTKRKSSKKTVRKTKKRTGPYSKKDSAGRRMWFSATGKRITKAKAYALMGKKLPKPAVKKSVRKATGGKKRTYTRTGLTAAQKKALKTKKLKKKLKKLKKQLKEQSARTTVSAQQPRRIEMSSQRPAPRAQQASSQSYGWSME
jgi:hypothetical protein